MRALKKFNVLEQAYQAFAKKNLTNAESRAYLKNVIEYPKLVPGKDGNGNPVLEDEASTRMKNRLEDLLALYEGGKGTELKGVKGTLWGAFNAVTEYTDYFNGKKNEKRAESTLFGSGAKIKTLAFDKAVELVG